MGDDYHPTDDAGTDWPKTPQETIHDIAVEAAPALSRIPAWEEWRESIGVIHDSIEAAVAEEIQ